MVQKEYETERLRLVLSHTRLAPKAVSFVRRNRSFLQPTEPEHGPEYYTKKQTRKALVVDMRLASRKAGFRFWLFEKGQDDIVGMAALNHVVWGPLRCCYLGYKLDKQHVGKGYATEAAKKLMDIAFNELELHRMEAHIMPGNTPSLHVAQKLGFEKEGVVKQYMHINGVWEDHIRFAKLNPKDT